MGEVEREAEKQLARCRKGLTKDLGLHKRSCKISWEQLNESADFSDCTERRERT